MHADQPAHDRGGAIAGRFGGLDQADLRGRTARGTVVNAAFAIGTSVVTLTQAFLLARLLSPAVLGLWGLLMAAFFTILTLGRVGTPDKFIQQDDPDQQRAFEIAFTFQAAIAAIFLVILGVGMPTFAVIYGYPEIIGPGLALIASIPALALQMTLWVHYRRMDFVKQRTLMAIDPVATFVVTIALVAAGLEIWGLVIGALVGSWLATIVIVRSSPYAFRLRWDREAFRDYRRFSWPLLVSSISTAVLIQAPVIVAARFLDVAVVAGIALAASISQFASKVDALITQTLYPAICAVKDRTDLLFESYWKSNRLALLWAVPFGAAAALFASDLVHYAIGEKWRFAVPLIVAFGISAAINQIGFNWTAFFRARGDTKPIATATVLGLVAVLLVPIPLLATSGIVAYGIGTVVATVVGVGIRIVYLRRIFPSLPILRPLVTGILPTLPSVGAVLILRVLDQGARPPGLVIAELFIFAAVTAAATYAVERSLLHELGGYLRWRRRTGEVPPPVEDATPQITIVIPTLGRVALLRRVLDCLDEQTADAALFEVIVVADGTEKRVPELRTAVADHAYRTLFMQSPREGASAKRNIGWGAASTPLVLFLGDDTLPERGLVSEHLAWHRRHSGDEVGVLGRIRWADELKVTPLMRWVETGIQFDYLNIEGIEAGWERFYTSNVSVKRAMLERVDGFEEEELPFLYEDLDLARRMHEHGFRLLYNRAAVAQHVHPMDLKYWEERVRGIAVAERQFVRRHPDFRPYFFELFSAAAALPPARGWGERVAHLIPRWVPVLGKRAWGSADMVYRQALAGPFLEAWRLDEENGQPTPSAVVKNPV